MARRRTSFDSGGAVFRVARKLAINSTIAIGYLLRSIVYLASISSMNHDAKIQDDEVPDSYLYHLLCCHQDTCGVIQTFDQSRRRRHSCHEGFQSSSNVAYNYLRNKKVRHAP